METEVPLQPNFPTLPSDRPLTNDLEQIDEEKSESEKETRKSGGSFLLNQIMKSNDLKPKQISKQASDSPDNNLVREATESSTPVKNKHVTI